MKPIAERIAQPTPAEVKRARRAVGLSQAAANQLVSTPAPERPERTWQNYETDAGKPAHRPIPLAIWELFLLVTGQHPTHRLAERDAAAA